MAERWSDPASERSTPRPIPRYQELTRRGPDPLEQGLDRLVSAGRQLVDGVSGARPGSRKATRTAAAGPGVRPRLGELGRWVEDKLDWILEDDDDWREPWQEPRKPVQAEAPVPRQQEPSPSPTSSRRRPLEAISRRGPALGPAAVSDQDWPDDENFSRPRWQRSTVQSAQQPLPPRNTATEASRPVPRSSRRRQLD
jgi:hypothetical protein